jgi:hypothetical protein
LKYLVQLDYHKTGQPFTEDTARTFTERIIFPTLARAEQLVKEGRIITGGLWPGELRFVSLPTHGESKSLLGSAVETSSGGVLCRLQRLNLWITITVHFLGDFIPNILLPL